MKKETFPFKKLGAAIAMLRAESGIYVEDLAKACHFSKSRYSEVAKGEM